MLANAVANLQLCVFHVTSVHTVHCVWLHLSTRSQKYTYTASINAEIFNSPHVARHIPDSRLYLPCLLQQVKL